jgi:hypothetical protein
MLGWALCGFHKKPTGTEYAEFVFLHLMGSVSHKVHSRASGEQNVDAIFFMLGWACVVSIKSVSGHVTQKLIFLHRVLSVGHVVHSAFWCIQHVKCRYTIFRVQMGLVWIS